MHYNEYMQSKKISTFAIVSIIALYCILLIPMSGCNPPTTRSNDILPASAEHTPPLLDTKTYGSLETAYFALG
jgi:hypothetical protein